MKNSELEDIKNKAEVIADVLGILSKTIKEVTEVVGKWETETPLLVIDVKEEPKEKKK